MIDHSTMSKRYEQYRSNFLAAMQRVDAELEHYAHPLLGPSSEGLFMDVGVLGNNNADKLIILASGTHGIEGYLGSELQSALLDGGVFDEIPAGTQVVFIHGVNPYGMAWHRRVNENNVDLNRNFVNFDSPLPYNEAYDLLSSAVNPQTYDDEVVIKAEQDMANFLEQHGFMDYLRALSGGQYHFPEGVQYGGQQQQWSNEQLQAIWGRYLPGKTLVTNIDLHSGLGERGEGVVMITGDEKDELVKRARIVWEGILLSPKPTEDDFIMSGVLGNFLENEFPAVDVIAMVLEFGTQDMTQVARAMIADNWLHQHGVINSEQGRAIKQQVFDAFYIDDADYRQQVYSRAEQVITAAFNL